jgi:hypothetical protein
MQDSTRSGTRRSGPRAAGIAVLAYAVGTFVAMGNAGPGGDFEAAGVTAWTSEGHRWGAFGVGYLGCFAALGLLVLAADATGAASGRAIFARRRPRRAA